MRLSRRSIDRSFRSWKTDLGKARILLFLSSRLHKLTQCFNSSGSVSRQLSLSIRRCKLHRCRIEGGMERRRQPHACSVCRDDSRQMEEGSEQNWTLPSSINVRNPLSCANVKSITTSRARATSLNKSLGNRKRFAASWPNSRVVILSRRRWQHSVMPQLKISLATICSHSSRNCFFPSTLCFVSVMPSSHPSCVYNLRAWL
mmetsp:Transcript_42268/g.68090  ORF Transcript_42268/g.68090 Transcript_42268/m.68090 type:complete len:202 (-) Transcript_42268:541-1146(-)